MNKYELKEIMSVNNLNVKQTAGLIHVSQRAVYNWLEGVRPMPPVASEFLKLVLSK